MTLSRSLIAVAAALATMVPAMANPHSITGEAYVAVGKLGTTGRNYMTIPQAIHYCKSNRGCRLSADYMGPSGEWTSGAQTRQHFPGSGEPFLEKVPGSRIPNNVIEVRY
jgi:hypothetical protein